MDEMKPCPPVKKVNLQDLRAAYKLIGVSVEVEKVPHLLNALKGAFFCEEKTDRVYVWQILARKPKNVRNIYGMGEKSFKALETMLRSKVGDDLVDEWLQEG